MSSITGGKCKTIGTITEGVSPLAFSSFVRQQSQSSRGNHEMNSVASVSHYISSCSAFVAFCLKAAKIGLDWIFNSCDHPFTTNRCRSSRLFLNYLMKTAVFNCQCFLFSSLANVSLKFCIIREHILTSKHLIWWTDNSFVCFIKCISVILYVQQYLSSLYKAYLYMYFVFLNCT